MPSRWLCVRDAISTSLSSFSQTVCAIIQVQLLHFPLASVCSVGALLQTSCARTVCYQPEYPPVLVHLQRNLTEYFVAVDINNMLQLYASMLHERRIIITSSKLSTVSPTRQTLDKHSVFVLPCAFLFLIRVEVELSVHVWGCCCLRVEL